MNAKTDIRTDFEIELERIDKDISELKHSVLPIDSEEATKFVYRFYQRAALTGNYVELEAAETAVNDAIRHGIGLAADLYLLKANLDFKFHRLADVRQDLEMRPGAADSVQARAGSRSRFSGRQIRGCKEGVRERDPGRSNLGQPRSPGSSQRQNGRCRRSRAIVRRGRRRTHG